MRRQRLAPSTLSVLPSAKPDARNLIGSSAVMVAVRTRLAKLAGVSWPAPIGGEPGTGKNVAAEWLHEQSGRPGPFITCPVAVLSASSGREIAELVGWAKGAFTDAKTDFAGPFEQAHRGTLFFDEIGLASPCVQEILLHFLQDKGIRRLGEQVKRFVDVRLVFATNIDLEVAVKQGRFRADLYDRLGRSGVVMPPLRERLEDVPELAATLIVRRMAEVKDDRPAPALTPCDLDRLMSYNWPGNVRELDCALAELILEGVLPAWVKRTHPSLTNWKSVIAAALARHGGNKSQAARALGISRPTLYAHMRRIGTR